MFKKTLVALIGAAAIFSAAASDAQTISGQAQGMNRNSFTAQSDLRARMRKLLDERVSYTRSFITSSLAGLEDTAEVTQRLLKNQDDIGDALNRIYGGEAGSKFGALLRGNILIAAEITHAAKYGNEAAVTAGKIKGRVNADEIASMLASMNPNWSQSQITDMLYKHLDYVIAQVMFRTKKDWAADIDANDRGHDHMLVFADMLTNGIIKQYPLKFPK